MKVIVCGILILCLFSSCLNSKCNLVATSLDIGKLNNTEVYVKYEICERDFDNFELKFYIIDSLNLQRKNLLNAFLSDANTYNLRVSLEEINDTIFIIHNYYSLMPGDFSNKYKGRVCKIKYISESDE